MTQEPKSLRRVTSTRVVGFSAAVRSLGTHKLGGHDVYYRVEHVRQVLKGKQRSEKLLRLIAKKCPQLFDVCECCEAVIAWWRANGTAA